MLNSRRLSSSATVETLLAIAKLLKIDQDAKPEAYRSALDALLGELAAPAEVMSASVLAICAELKCDPDDFAQVRALAGKSGLFGTDAPTPRDPAPPPPTSPARSGRPDAPAFPMTPSPAAEDGTAQATLDEVGGLLGLSSGASPAAVADAFGSASADQRAAIANLINVAARDLDDAIARLIAAAQAAYDDAAAKITPAQLSICLATGCHPSSFLQARASLSGGQPGRYQ